MMDENPASADYAPVFRDFFARLSRFLFSIMSSSPTLHHVGCILSERLGGTVSGFFIPNQSQLHSPENKSCVKETYAVTMEVETHLSQKYLFSCLDHVRYNETYYLISLSPLGF